jgi:hypothetical protein
MKEIIVLFEFPSGNAAQYDNVWEDLRAAGHEYPKGLVSHIAGPRPDGGWLVVDVWDSENAFKEFGKTLIPIIQKNDLPVVEPRIVPVHNIYKSAENAVI